MNNSVILVNQVTGPLFIDIANQYAMHYKNVILITGSVEPTYAELNNKIKIILKTKYRRNKPYLRIFTWSLFFIQVFIFFCFTKKSNIKSLIVSNPPVLPFLGSYLLPKKNISFDILIYDIFPDALVNLGYIKQDSIIFKFWDHLLKKSYKKADRVITISSIMKQIISRNISKTKIEIIYPWVDTSFVMPVKKNKNLFLRKYNLQDKKIVMYSGNMGNLHDLITPLKAANILKNTNPEYHFIYIGDGSQKPLLENYVTKNKLKNVSFLPFQDPDVLKYSLPAADYGIVSLGEGSKGISVPSKTYYYLAAGVSIIAITPKGSEIDRLVSKYNCGISIEPKKIRKLSNFLINDSKANLDLAKKNARKLSFKFSKENAKKFL